jgi:hypothetical protein
MPATATTSPKIKKIDYERLPKAPATPPKLSAEVAAQRILLERCYEWVNQIATARQERFTQVNKEEKDDPRDSEFMASYKVAQDHLDRRVRFFSQQIDWIDRTGTLHPYALPYVANLKNAETDELPGELTGNPATTMAAKKTQAGAAEYEKNIAELKSLKMQSAHLKAEIERETEARKPKPIDVWNQRLAEIRKLPAANQPAAISALVKREPALHAAYLKAVNDQRRK